jgi:serine/threonine protein kinase
VSGRDADRDLERLEALFQAAADLPARERGAFLDERDLEPELRRRVELMLASLEYDASLHSPWPSLAPTSLSTLTAGRCIGPWRLVEELGAGGFGVVWRAERKGPVAHPVALKLIKLGMDTREVLARFEAEREALARMDHPGIARVLDGGATEEGRPYFVMELVQGTSITEHCDQERLETRARLELFVKVCQAVQHAHQKGVIHRDLKPTNVLVSRRGGEAAPKVIDFGIAKAMQGRLGEHSLMTLEGRLVGTPAYMSPEQAGGSVDVDTRADVYSLGVILYELLTGSTPFAGNDLLREGLAEVRRVICEQLPERPSTRIAACTDTTVAAGRTEDRHRHGRGHHRHRVGAEAWHARCAPARGWQVRARLRRRRRPLRSRPGEQHRSRREPSVPHGRHPEPRGRAGRTGHAQGGHDPRDAVVRPAVAVR